LWAVKRPSAGAFTLGEPLVGCEASIGRSSLRISTKISLRISPAAPARPEGGRAALHLPPYCDGAFTYSHTRHHVITSSHHHVTTSSRRTHAHGALSRTRPPCTAFIHSAHIAYGALWPVPSGLYPLACTLWPVPSGPDAPRGPALSIALGMARRSRLTPPTMLRPPCYALHAFRSATRCLESSQFILAAVNEVRDGATQVDASPGSAAFRAPATLGS